MLITSAGIAKAPSPAVSVYGVFFCIEEYQSPSAISLPVGIAVAEGTGAAKTTLTNKIKDRRIARCFFIENETPSQNRSF